MLDLCDFNNFSLFDQLSAMEAGVISGGNDSATFIKHESSPWPNVIYNVKILHGEENLFSSLLQLIEGHSLQPLVFCDEVLVDPSTFKVHRFLPIDRWTKMQLDLNSYVPQNGTSGFLSSVVSGQDQLQDWLEIVSRTLFNSKKLDLGLFTKMIESPDFMFHIGLLNGFPVSASLTYIDKNKIAGIYMVSTFSEYQGKGYARMLLENVFSDLLKEGIITCVLQSTKAGLKLYAKMGFQSFGHLNLYWKIK